MNRRIGFYRAFVAVLFGVCAVGNSRAQDKTKTDSSQHPPLKSIDKYLKGIDRRIEVAPKHVDDGINTGLVILFGHPIKPPYKIVFEDNKMSVNGVEVVPSPVGQREYAKTYQPPTLEKLARAAKITDWTHAAQEIYRTKKGTVPDEDLKKEILDYVKAQPLVKDAKWDSKDYMSVKLKDDKYDSFGYGVMFSMTKHIPESDEDKKVRTEKIQKDYVRELEGELRQKKSLFFTTDGGVFHDYEDVRNKVNGVMADNKLSHDEKIKTLRENVFAGNLVAALDVVTNYRVEEWKAEGH